VRVEVAADREDAPIAVLEALMAAARPALDGDDLLGPAPLLRLRGRTRAQLLVKTRKPARAGGVLGDLVARQTRALRKAGAQVVIDVDPQ
jgi:primosomal protein N'